MAKKVSPPKRTDRAPGSLVYTGQYTDIKPEIDVYQFNSSDISRRLYHSVDQLPEKLDPDSVYWFNLTGLNNPTVIQYFGDRFGIHEMHLEDIVQVNRHAKIDLTEQYLMSEHYMIYQSDEMHYESVVLFLFPGVVLSFQEFPGDVFEPIRHRLELTDSRVRRSGADYLYYLLVDRLVDEAVAVLKDLVYQLDDMERQMLDESQIDMRRAYAIKRELLNVKSAIYPLDGLFMLLMGEQNHVLKPDIIPYIKDIEDHVDQSMVEIGRAVDTIENMNQSNMAQLSNQMNSIMKVLTIFSAIFIPLNFITGMYGMNFLHMPFLQHPYAFYGFALASVAIVTILVAYFKRKNWF